MKRLLTCITFGLALLAWSFTGRFRDPDPALLANAAYSEGDFARAAKQFERAERIHPDKPELASNEAAALYRLQRFSEAEEHYRTAAEQADDLRSARAEYDRGNCAVNLACKSGDHSDPKLLNHAADHYRACLDKQDAVGEDPLFRDARHNLELTKLLLGRDAPADPFQDLSWQQSRAADPRHDGLDDLCPDCRRKALEARAGAIQEDTLGEKADATSKPGNKGEDQGANADPKSKQGGSKRDKNSEQTAKANPTKLKSGDSQKQPDSSANTAKAQQPQDNQTNPPSS